MYVYMCMYVSACMYLCTCMYVCMFVCIMYICISVGGLISSFFWGGGAFKLEFLNILLWTTNSVE
jgi:hypothetical protein